MAFYVASRDLISSLHICEVKILSTDHFTKQKTTKAGEMLEVESAACFS